MFLRMNLLPLFSNFEWAYSMGLYLPVSLGFFFFSFILFLFISFSSSLPFPSFHSTVLCTNTKLWMWNIHSHTAPKLNQSLEFDTSRTTTKAKNLYMNIYSCNCPDKIVEYIKFQFLRPKRHCPFTFACSLLLNSLSYYLYRNSQVFKKKKKSIDF